MPGRILRSAARVAEGDDDLAVGDGADNHKRMMGSGFRVAGRLRERRGTRCSLSMGQRFKCTHRMVFTAYLQDDGLSDASSVTVNQLNVPSLHGALAGSGGHPPSGGGGVAVDAGRIGVRRSNPMPPPRSAAS